jgi:hypothetical protein
MGMMAIQVAVVFFIFAVIYAAGMMTNRNK